MKLPGFAGELLAPMRAVRLWCATCQDLPQSATPACAETDCSLFGLARMHASRTDPELVVQAIGRFCKQCAGGKREVRACAAGKGYLDSEPCPLWPYRLGIDPFAKRQAQPRQAKPAESKGLLTLE